MSEITQQTLIDLQLPTMSLVEKFCETPEEVKSFFAGMTAVYENDPTGDNIRRIADKTNHATAGSKNKTGCGKS